MRLRATRLLILALAASCCAPADAAPAAAPNALAAASSWESRHAVALTPQARDALTATVLNAVPKVASAAGLRAADVEAGSGPAVEDYLDAVRNGQRSGPAFSDRLAQDFVLNASPGPHVQQALAMVQIVYQHDVDNLVVGDRTMARPTAVIAVLGPLKISGRRAGQVVCQGEVAVALAQNNVFTC